MGLICKNTRQSQPSKSLDPFHFYNAREAITPNQAQRTLSRSQKKKTSNKSFFFFYLFCFHLFLFKWNPTSNHWKFDQWRSHLHRQQSFLLPSVANELSLLTQLSSLLSCSLNGLTAFQLADSRSTPDSTPQNSAASSLLTMEEAKIWSSTSFNTDSLARWSGGRRDRQCTWCCRRIRWRRMEKWGGLRSWRRLWGRWWLLEWKVWLWRFGGG